jgi:hypothetical protein
MTSMRSTSMEAVSVLDPSRRSGVPARDIYQAIDEGLIAGFRDGSEIKVRVDDLAVLDRRSPG